MKKASKKQFMRLLVVLCVVFSFSVIVIGDEGMATVSQGRDVEVIYDGIRHSAPEYEWEESIVTFENEGLTLVCTLTIPISPRRCPIIITLNGFVGSRDEFTIPGTDEGMLKRLTRTLAEQGFASLRVDFRGSGDSEGEYSITSFSSQISDAMAAVEFVVNHLHDQVNYRKIGIVGYSQGGLIGTLTAARDKRVDSLVLWSPVSHPPIVYEGLLTKAGLKNGLSLQNGESINLGIYVDGEYLGLDAHLGKGFFEDIFKIDPLAEIRSYKKPLMVIVGRKDLIIWPQPAMGELFLNYHVGLEKLVLSEGDHDFDYWVEGPNPETLDDSIYWTIAWFIKTL